jgi:hypothetical protein
VGASTSATSKRFVYSKEDGLKRPAASFFGNALSIYKFSLYKSACHEPRHWKKIHPRSFDTCQSRVARVLLKYYSAIRGFCVSFNKQTICRKHIHLFGQPVRPELFLVVAQSDFRAWLL